MNFVQKVCVFITMSKRNNCSFCCFLNHIICFCKARVMPMQFCAMRQNPVTVPLFVFIVEIVIKVSNNETVLLRKKLIMRTIMKEIKASFWHMIFIT